MLNDDQVISKAEKQWYKDRESKTLPAKFK